MSTVTGEKPASPVLSVVVLRAVLVVLAIGCVIGYWKANAQTDDYRLQYPTFTPWFWNLYLTFYLASVVGLFAMWNWHKWGLWLLAAMAIAMLFTEFFAMGFAATSLRIPAAFAAVWFAAQPVWKRFV